MLLFLVRLATSPTLVLDDAGTNNDDQDGNSNNDNAILIEDMIYHFQCSFLINTVDPSPNIRWDLYDDSGNLLHTETDNGQDNNCQALAYSQTYELTANLVTFAGLQCGFLVCTAFTADVPLVANSQDPFADTNQFKDRIDFQIWSKYLSCTEGFLVWGMVCTE